ncbi:MAG: hypothetical protein ACRYG8_01445 [Janthinobacterium lividum]
MKAGIDLAEGFLKLSADERSALHGALSNKVRFKLLVLSGYMAEAAIDDQSEALVRVGALMHIIEDFESDYRENFRYLVLLAQASAQIGANFGQLITSLSNTMTKRAREYFTDFLDRDPSLNELRLFGIQQLYQDGATAFVAIPDRFSYRKTSI